MLGARQGQPVDLEGLRAARLYRNLPVSALYEEALRRREALVAAEGPLVCLTGVHTGRSPNDKFFVREPSSDKVIHWGGFNRPLDPARFDVLRGDLLASLERKDL